jgi:tetrahydromethanopterin S-methyltransferase subunit G
MGDGKFTPQWKETVDKRLGDLERNVEGIRSDMSQRFDRIETLLSNR